MKIVVETAAVVIPKVITKTWLSGLKNKPLVEVLKKAKEAYYNSSKPIMSDALFDYAEDLLRDRKPDDPYFNIVGAPATVSKGAPQKVRLTLPMGSLSKVKTADEINGWLSGVKEVVAEDKLDGLSVQIDDRSGKMKAVTRGNGTIGQDISHLLPYMKGRGKSLPKGWVIRGEIMVSRADFVGKLAKDFANTRNLASGIINSSGVNPNANKLTLVIHTVMKPDQPIHKAAAKLKALGWSVVPFKVLKGDIAKLLPAYLAERKKKSLFDIDGLVLESEGQKIAFKGEDVQAAAIVKEVEWNPSRYGMLNPVVILRKPVMLAGVAVTRATAYNAKFIQENGIGPGAIIKIARSGEVIPKIMSVTKKATPSLPPKGTFVWNDTNVDIYVNFKNMGKSTADLIVTRQLSYWLGLIGVEGTKGGLVYRLVESGIRDIVALRKATVAKLQNAGLGPTQAKSLKTGIDAAMAAVDLATMMDASGLWPRGWGRSRFEAVLRKFSYHVLLTEAAKPKTADAKLTNMITQINGFGPKLMEGFGPALIKFDKLIKQIGFEPKPPTPEKKPSAKGPLKGMNFAFTGFRPDADLEKRILGAGGVVGDGIRKETTHLVVADKNSTSLKVQAAEKKGIKVIDRAALEKLLKG